LYGWLRQPDERSYLPAHEVEAMLGVSPAHLRRLVALGVLKARGADPDGLEVEPAILGGPGLVAALADGEVAGRGEERASALGQARASSPSSRPGDPPVG
jgi:hypothetical protein